MLIWIVAKIENELSNPERQIMRCMIKPTAKFAFIARAAIIMMENLISLITKNIICSSKKSL